MLPQLTGVRGRRSSNLFVGRLTMRLDPAGAQLYCQGLIQGCLRRDCGYVQGVTPSPEVWLAAGAGQGGRALC